MRVRIEHELQLFPVRTANFETRRTLSPGRYDVEPMVQANGESWWKLKGQDWGNAADCWQAVQPGGEHLGKRLETLSKKAALLLAALVFACLLIQTDWVQVKTHPDLKAPGQVLAALGRQYLEGAAYSVRPEPDGGFLVSRYASGWQLLREAFSHRGRAFEFFQRHLAQIHKELLLLLMAATVFFPHRQVVVTGLKFLLPVLLLPLLGTPVCHPLLDQPLPLYYLGLAAATAALVWNLPALEENPTPISHGIAGVTTWLALVYNGLVFSVLVLLRF